MSVIEKIGCCLVFVSALGASKAGATQVITQPFLGVQRIYQTDTSPRPLKIHVAIIDLTAPGISFEMTPRAANYPGPIINGSPGETVRQTTRQFADAVGAQVAINGSYYASLTQSGVNWANNLGITASNGDHYSPWENPFSTTDFRDALNISQTNQALIVKMPASIPTGFETNPPVTLYNTVTGFGRIVQNGVNVAPSSCSPCGLNPRTAVGVTADNKLVMMVVDGRQAGFSEGLTMIETAELMRTTYGVIDAIDLDGGGSSTMVMNFYNDAFAGQVLNSPSDGSERSVGDNLAVFALPNGDYNKNGVLDSADYVVWRKSIGGQLAYDAWRSKFGNAAASGLGSGSTVPEPATWAVAVLALLIFIGLRVFPTRFGNWR